MGEFPLSLISGRSIIVMSQYGHLDTAALADVYTLQLAGSNIVAFNSLNAIPQPPPQATYVLSAVVDSPPAPVPAFMTATTVFSSTLQTLAADLSASELADL